MGPIEAGYRWVHTLIMETLNLISLIAIVGAFVFALIQFIREVRAEARRRRSRAAIDRVLGVTDGSRRIIYDEMGKPVMYDGDGL